MANLYIQFKCRECEFQTQRREDASEHADRERHEVIIEGTVTPGRIQLLEGEQENGGA